LDRVDDRACGPGFVPINAGKPRSDMDDSDLLDFDAQGRSIAETAEFLCREEREVWRGSKR
jgi:hypothetical protein